MSICLISPYSCFLTCFRALHFGSPMSRLQEFNRSFHQFFKGILVYVRELFDIDTGSALFEFPQVCEQVFMIRGSGVDIE